MRYILVALMLFLIPCVARAATRDVLVLNTGDEAIFSLRIGHVATGSWGDDLLPYNDVIGVSAGKIIQVPFDAVTCGYDVQATLSDGKVVVLPRIDLCVVDRLIIGS